MSAPRVVTGSDIAKTSAGATLQSEQLEKTAKSAATALLAVAILMLIGLGLLWFLFQSAGARVDWDVATPLLIAQLVMSVVFFALWIWARKSPLPAAITGLVIFGSMHIINAFIDPTTIAQGLIVKVIVVVVLCKAISAGLQHRKLIDAHAGKHH